jgi:FKBP-type peptidyl-prolyl cis-trans isomerase FkpA
MTLKAGFLLGALAAVLVACNADYKKTKDGMAYKVFSRGKGAAYKHGQFLKVYYSSRLGDSLLQSNFGKVPAYGMFDTSVHNAYEFVDFLGEMKVGDSAVYSRSVDTLVKRGVMQYNNVLEKGSVLSGSIVVLASFESEQAVRADQEKELELEKQREVAALEQLLKSKNIKPTAKTAGGVFVIITQDGTGAKADSGTRVTVNYTGRLKNGVVFDSNLDSSFQHVQPLQFQVGTRSVIAGWDEGIQYFKAGSRGQLYVPAMMAYGLQSQGEKLPAFSDLVFDIEVTKVEPAAVLPDAPNAAAQSAGGPIR